MQTTPSILVRALLLITACSACLLCRPTTAAPGIEDGPTMGISSVGKRFVTGQIFGVARPRDWRVVVYVHLPSEPDPTRFVLRPNPLRPFGLVGPRLRFNVRFVQTKLDLTATDVVVFLVPKNSELPPMVLFSELGWDGNPYLVLPMAAAGTRIVHR